MDLTKTDLAKVDKNYYSVSQNPSLREFDTYHYLAIQGKSAPEAPEFTSAIEAIYGIAYSIKFMCKEEGNDFTVPKMECFWFVDGGPELQHKFPETPRDQWRWQIVIRMPEMVSEQHFSNALTTATEKKRGVDFSQVKFEPFNGGVFAQILHIGSYEKEAPTIQKLHEFISREGFEISGYHCEVYLSDPRRVAEGKLRTIIKYRVKPVEDK